MAGLLLLQGQLWITATVPHRCSSLLITLQHTRWFHLRPTPCIFGLPAWCGSAPRPLPFLCGATGSAWEQLPPQPPLAAACAVCAAFGLPHPPEGPEAGPGPPVCDAPWSWGAPGRAEPPRLLPPGPAPGPAARLRPQRAPRPCVSGCWSGSGRAAAWWACRTRCSSSSASSPCSKPGAAVAAVSRTAPGWAGRLLRERLERSGAPRPELRAARPWAFQEDSLPGLQQPPRGRPVLASPLYTRFSAGSGAGSCRARRGTSRAGSRTPGGNGGDVPARQGCCAARAPKNWKQQQQEVPAASARGCVSQGIASGVLQRAALLGQGLHQSCWDLYPNTALLARWFTRVLFKRISKELFMVQRINQPGVQAFSHVLIAQAWDLLFALNCCDLCFGLITSRLTALT